MTDSTPLCQQCGKRRESVGHPLCVAMPTLPGSAITQVGVDKMELRLPWATRWPS